MRPHSLLRRGAFVALGIALVTPTRLTAEGKPVPATDRVVAIVSASAVDASQMAQAIDHLSKSLPVRFKLSTVAADSAKDADSSLSLVRKQRNAEEAVYVLLARMNEDVPRLLVDPDEGLAVINVTALHLENSKTPQTRLDAQLARALAAALGIGLTTADPRCINRPIAKVEELDNLPGGFYPPAYDAVLTALEEKGALLPLPAPRHRVRPPVAPPAAPAQTH